MLRFVHAADIHLDSPLRGLANYDGAPVEALRHATRRAFDNLVRFVKQEGVPLLLISGDLYDGDWKDFNTGLYFHRAMVELGAAGVRVAVLRGNHDAANAMTASLPPAENVFVLDHRAPQTIRFEDLGVAVHGQSFTAPREERNLAADYPTAAVGLFNIGMLHTAMNGAAGHERYAPCRLDDLLSKGYDYWALGHVHAHEVVHASPPVLWAGCLQGRHIRESGVKGCVLVEVEPGGGSPRWSHVPMDVARWLELEVDISGARTLDEAVGRFAEALQTTLDEMATPLLATRVRFVGSAHAHEELATEPTALAASLRAAALSTARDFAGEVWVEKIRVDTTPALDLEALAASATPRGDLLRFIEECIEDEAQFEALGLDLTALKGKLRAAGVTPPDLDDPAVRRESLRQARDLILPQLAPLDEEDED